jgi:hypothetical protein
LQKFINPSARELPIVNTKRKLLKNIPTKHENLTKVTTEKREKKKRKGN